MGELLQDYFEVDTVQVIAEGNGSSPMKVRGVFGRVNEFNNNKRRYPKAVLQREVSRLQPLAEGGRLVGELDHPEHTNIKLTEASHKIVNLKMQGNKIIGEAHILNTPAGKVAQQLIKDGVHLGISSRGLGTLTEVPDKPGYSEVNEDYKCITFDLVADPSTRGAAGYISESTDPARSALYQRTKEEYVREQIILKVLENRLRDLRQTHLKSFGDEQLDEARGKKTKGTPWALSQTGEVYVEEQTEEVSESVSLSEKLKTLIEAFGKPEPKTAKDIKKANKDHYAKMSPEERKASSKASWKAALKTRRKMKDLGEVPEATEVGNKHWKAPARHSGQRVEVPHPANTTQPSTGAAGGSKPSSVTYKQSDMPVHSGKAAEKSKKKKLTEPSTGAKSSGKAKRSWNPKDFPAHSGKGFPGAGGHPVAGAAKGKLPEGVTTGGDPEMTGKRVGSAMGKALLKGKRMRHEGYGKETRVERVGKKLNKKYPDKKGAFRRGVNKGRERTLQAGYGKPGLAGSPGVDHNKNRRPLPSESTELLNALNRILEKRFDDEGKPIPSHKRAFTVGTKMAEREHKDPSTSKVNKKRREKLKKKGHRSVSAGMAQRSKDLRGEDTY